MSKAGKQIVAAYGAGKLATFNYTTHNGVGDYLLLRRKYRTDNDGVLEVAIEVGPETAKKAPLTPQASPV